jgi:uncharacterized protein YbjT (DUF2867 family)
MKRILITGATGNVGLEVIRFLLVKHTNCQVVAGVRNISEAKKKLIGTENLEFVRFDFEDPGTFKTALEKVDSVFLLRPPHLSEVDRYFKPLVAAIVQAEIQEVIFLSVQGAEKSKVIPHNQIEKLITDSGIDYIFLRPSYFMQNLTTTLLKDIQQKRKIFLPAGKAKFNWIDIENIGESAAILFEKFQEYRNQAIELTGNENRSFGEVADLITQTLKEKIEFINANPFRFYRIKKQEKMQKGMILVMILLHFLPRFQKEPVISGFYERLTGKKPTTLKEFIECEKGKLQGF